ncbi:MAG: porin [Phycisphaerales bacterium]
MRVSIAITAAALAASAGGAVAGDEASAPLNDATRLMLRTDAASRSFEIESSPFTPIINGYVEFRYDLNHTKGGTMTSEDLTTGFSLPRSRIKVTGNIHERARYEIEGQFSSSDGSFVVLDAYGAFEIADGTELWLGQFVAPYLREFTLAPWNQLGAERSAMNRVFTVGRTQGVMLARTTDRWRTRVSFNDGANTRNTDFTSTAEADLALTGRLEYLGSGAWSQFADFSSFRGSDRAWMLGLAGHWQDGGETALTPDASLTGVTADFSVEGDGFNAFAALAWQRTDSAAGDFDDLGVLVQGGVFVTDIVELFARYDVILADDDRTADSDFHTLTAGLNWYLIPESQAAKVTLDVQYFLDAEASSPITPSTGVGLLGSTDEQVNVRLQISMVF